MAFDLIYLVWNTMNEIVGSPYLVSIFIMIMFGGLFAVIFKDLVIGIVASYMITILLVAYIQPVQLVLIIILATSITGVLLKILNQQNG
jgi:hypothetical protein